MSRAKPWQAPMPPMPPMPSEYLALLQRLELPSALEAVHRILTRVFELDAERNSDRDEALLRVLLTIRLAPEEAIRAKDISVQVLKSTSHTSRLIDRAEAAGLIERRPDPSDRRAHRVVLTPEGEAAIDAYVPHAVAILDRAYGSALAPEELKTAIDLLKRVEATALKLVGELESEARRRS